MRESIRYLFAFYAFAIVLYVCLYYAWKDTLKYWYKYSRFFGGGMVSEHQLVNIIEIEGSALDRYKSSSFVGNVLAIIIFVPMLITWFFFPQNLAGDVISGQHEVSTMELVYTTSLSRSLETHSSLLMVVIFAVNIVMCVLIYQRVVSHCILMKKIPYVELERKLDENLLRCFLKWSLAYKNISGLIVTVSKKHETLYYEPGGRRYEWIPFYLYSDQKVLGQIEHNEGVDFYDNTYNVDIEAQDIPVFVTGRSIAGKTYTIDNPRLRYLLAVTLETAPCGGDKEENFSITYELPIYTRGE